VGRPDEGNVQPIDRAGFVRGIVGYFTQ
jgi:hypothetical protein